MSSSLRFFYTYIGSKNFHPFTKDQINVLAQRTLGDLICDNTNITKVPTDIFSTGSPTMSCDNRTMLNASLFLNLGQRTTNNKLIN